MNEICSEKTSLVYEMAPIWLNLFVDNIQRRKHAGLSALLAHSQRIGQRNFSEWTDTCM